MASNDLSKPLLIDDEDIEVHIERTMREGFVTKVYGIVLFQICITSCFILLSLFSSSYRSFLYTHMYIEYIALSICLILVFVPLCCPVILQRVPINYLYLLLFTSCLGYSISFGTAGYSPQTVTLAVVLTIVTVITITIYAWRTKTDFTIYGGVLFVCLILLILGSLFSWMFYVPIFHTFLIILSLILFSIYLIYDTQLLMGTRGSKYSEDDYILAAMNIYLDVINIFLELLSLIGRE